MSELSKDFAAALVKMQGELKSAEKTAANEFFKKNGKATPYADLASCWDACREALQANGMALLQPVVDAPSGFVGIRTVLVYGPTAETMEHTYAVPLKDATNPQAMGSAITYGRRYGLCAFLGICPAEDDGNAASGNGQPKPKAGPPLKPSDVQAKFDQAKSLEERKAIYKDTQNANIPEPSKSQLLSKFLEAIKQEKSTK